MTFEFYPIGTKVKLNRYVEEDEPYYHHPDEEDEGEEPHMLGYPFLDELDSAGIMKIIGNTPEIGGTYTVETNLGQKYYLPHGILDRVYTIRRVR